MKFEEILPYIREGESFKKRDGTEIYNKYSSISINLKSIVIEEYELVRKVKYYPALIQDGEYYITGAKFKDLIDALHEAGRTGKLIRLVKEVPELIVERDE